VNILNSFLGGVRDRMREEGFIGDGKGR